MQSVTFRLSFPSAICSLKRRSRHQLLWPGGRFRLHRRRRPARLLLGQRRSGGLGGPAGPPVQYGLRHQQPRRGRRMVLALLRRAIPVWRPLPRRPAARVTFPLCPATTRSCAFGINDSGVICSMSMPANGGPHAVLWRNGQVDRSRRPAVGGVLRSLRHQQRRDVTGESDGKRELGSGRIPVVERQIGPISAACPATTPSPKQHASTTLARSPANVRPRTASPPPASAGAKT